MGNFDIEKTSWLLCGMSGFLSRVYCKSQLCLN